MKTRIKKWRIENRYNKQQFAKAVNISPTSLYLYERHGLGNASINTLLNIMTFTGLAFDEIDFTGWEHDDEQGNR